MSMSAFQQLSSILQSELNQSKQLQSLLQQEREALKTADLDTIQSITQQKQSPLVQLEQLGRQRDYVLKAAGFPVGKAGLEAFIANQAESDSNKIKQVLSELRQVAKSCREDNQINGGILNVNRQYLVRALSILRGRDPETGAYGPGGEFTSQVVRQPLIGRV
jgi:flagella synthesis protein FlgN